MTKQPFHTLDSPRQYGCVEFLLSSIGPSVQELWANDQATLSHIRFPASIWANDQATLSHSLLSLVNIMTLLKT